MQIFTMAAVAIFIFSLFLMTNAALPVWQSISLLQKFQFPWRLMSVAVFVTSIVGAICISIVSKKREDMDDGDYCAQSQWLAPFYVARKRIYIDA